MPRVFVCTSRDGLAVSGLTVPYSPCGLRKNTHVMSKTIHCEISNCSETCAYDAVLYEHESLSSLCLLWSRGWLTGAPSSFPISSKATMEPLARWYSVVLDRPHCCSLQSLLCSLCIWLCQSGPSLSARQAAAPPPISASALGTGSCVRHRHCSQGFTLLSDAPTLLTGCWYLLHSIENKSVSDFSIKLGTHSVSRVLSSPTSCTSNQPISWLIIAWKNFCLILCICLPAARHQNETWM